MAFNDFKTISEVQEKFGIKYAMNDFVGAEETLKPSEHFLLMLLSKTEQTLLWIICRFSLGL